MHFDWHFAKRLRLHEALTWKVMRADVFTFVVPIQLATELAWISLLIGTQLWKVSRTRT